MRLPNRFGDMNHFAFSLIDGSRRVRCRHQCSPVGCTLWWEAESFSRGLESQTTDLLGEKNFENQSNQPNDLSPIIHLARFLCP